MPSPWFLLLMAILVAGTYVAGRHDGAKINEAVWQKREAEINGKQADLIAKANQAVRDEEHRRVTDINNVAADYEDKLKGKDNALQTALNSLKSGGGLFLHTACPAPSGDTKGGVATSPRIDNGSARVQFPETDARFLLGLASEADRNTAQLTACQALIKADRK